MKLSNVFVKLLAVLFVIIQLSAISFYTNIYSLNQLINQETYDPDHFEQKNLISFLENSNFLQNIENSSINLPPASLIFSSLFESLGEESTTTGSMALSSDDSIIIGGSTTSQSIQMINAYESKYNGGSTDAFFCQYLSNGKLLKSTYFGGNGNDEITNIALDSQDNIIIAGVTDSTNLPYTDNAFDFIFNGYTDIFIAKFSYNGDLLWSTYFGGSYTDTISDLALDSDDDIYITGSTDSNNFPSFNSSPYGERDGFVAKFSSNGSLMHSMLIGGSSNDFATDLLVTKSNVYVTGFTSSTDFNFFGTNSNLIHGNSDGFIISYDLDLNPAPNEILFGGNGFETDTRLVFDGTNVIIVGNTNSTDHLSTADFNQSTSVNNTNIFLNKISLSSKSVIWSRYIGGANFDYSSDIYLSQNNIITLAGKTNSSTTFPIRNAYDNEFSGGFDAFFSQFDSGGKLISSSFLGGSADDEIKSITYDSLGMLYLSGITKGNFPQTLTNSYLNTSELFLAKFSQIKDPYVVNRFGGYCTTITSSCDGKFNNPTGLAIGPDHNLYVVDSENNNVQVLTQDGQFIRKFGSLGSGVGEFNNPNSIAIRSDGRIFVSDVNNHRIQIFDSNGNYISFISSLNGTLIASPIGIAVNETDYLFITDRNTSLVSIFYPNLTIAKQFGGFAADNGKFLYGLAGITVKNGFIYVSDTGNNRIQVFDLNGNFIRQWGKSGINIGEFNATYQIFVLNNYLYSADFNNHRIQIFTLSGAFVTTIVGSTDNNQNQFKNPFGITVNNSGYIYLSSIYYHTIISFRPISISDSLTINLDYFPQFYYTGQGSQIYNSPPSLPSGFDISFGGTTKFLYVIDNATNCVRKFSIDDIGSGASWDNITSFGSLGSGINNFNQSSDIAINKSNSIYITDTNNNRVVIYNASDKYIKSFGLYGGQDGNFSKPIGIAFSQFNNLIYVVDTGNNRIQMFDWNGTFMGKWGSFGSSNGQFDHPYGIAVDNKDGNVYVSDQNNNRIQVFNSTGYFLFTFGIKGNSYGEFDNPGHIVIDTNSYVYITDIGNKRIQIFDKNGVYKNNENKFGSTLPLMSVNGITIDENNNLYYNYYSLIDLNTSLTYIYKFEQSTNYNGNPYTTFSPQQQILSLDVDPYGKTISVGLLNNSVIDYDLSTQTSIQSVTIHSNPVSALDYSTDGLILATGGLDNKIVLINKNGDNTTLIGHNGPVYAVKFFANNKLLASASSDKTIKIWNVTAGSLVTTLVGHTEGILSIAISPANNILISGSLDKTIKIWNLTSYSLIKTLTSHSDFITGLAYSPNGNDFVSVSFDKVVILWNGKSFVELGRMFRHTDKIHSVAFSPDSTEFATGDESGMIYIWNAQTMKATWQLKDHTGIIYSLKYSPDGTFLISGSADQKVKIWSISAQTENDLDKDGMNDYWEVIHGLSPYNFDDKFLDPDGDGIINSIEEFLGSNPQSNDTDKDYFNDKYEFSVGLNPIYNDDLGDKDNDGMPNIFEFKYGLNLLNPTDPNKDLDNDGLTNMQEFKFGSYPNNNDSDGDGLPDYIEFIFGLKPLINDSYSDLDSDGMPNLWEYQNGLRLDFNDSYLDLDFDGMPNIFEYTYSFDPQNPLDASLDADGDGYTNLEEYLMGTDPRNPLDPPIIPTTSHLTNSTYNFLNDPLVITSFSILVISGGIISGAVFMYRGYLRKKDEFRL